MIRRPPVTTRPSARTGPVSGRIGRAKLVLVSIVVKLWPGGELYLNPEFDRGFGLSDTLGAAGFPSGEAYKVGHHSAYGKLQRAFLRQVFALGEAATPLRLLAASLIMAGLVLMKIGKA